MGLLCLTNLYAVARLAKYAKLALNDYVAERKQGLEPQFDPNLLGSTNGVHAWGKE